MTIVLKPPLKSSQKSRKKSRLCINGAGIARLERVQTLLTSNTLRGQRRFLKSQIWAWLIPTDFHPYRLIPNRKNSKMKRKRPLYIRNAGSHWISSSALIAEWENKTKTFIPFQVQRKSKGKVCLQAKRTTLQHCRSDQEYRYSPWMGCKSITSSPPALWSPVPIYTFGWGDKVLV